jgi:hypothetical protein
MPNAVDQPVALPENEVPTSGVKNHPSQMQFEWCAPSPPRSEAPPATARVTPALPSELPAKTLPSPGASTISSGQLGTKPLNPYAINRAFREKLERYFRDHGIPYISVDEAKRALFASAKLRSFHFVVYRPSGKNWLLWAAHMRKDAREDLKQWVGIFGEGFIGVVAKPFLNGVPVFRTLEGEPVELEVR